jgi:hypothetical protein
VNGRLPSQYWIVARTDPTLNAVGSVTAVADTAIAVFVVLCAWFGDPLAELQAANKQSNGTAVSDLSEAMTFLSQTPVETRQTLC